ncbi:hypothetical protein TSOC_009376 [Tetrabaena socialis]|uniref:Uncharacterized protein n=1 Tax=Tetrabaena socialis TaxID=47790 RepID=A0A2J7ZW17_9CHLO|nr:hypothetical protein TSOC_009376 [Tetrabaena socialis]|eukprot:PNH04455.1 hypothetical protein TSOC_009376 [Tetrabaena socialis]
MAQQGQQAPVFNALKPTTAASFGKENNFAGSQGTAPLAAPPKLSDFSHLQAAGPRRHVSQRYALQPNLNVSRPVLLNSTGVTGLLGPSALPAAGPSQQAQQQPALRERPSAPSSPTARGLQSANPNFLPTSISTRLPTPVRINSVPGGCAQPTSSGGGTSLVLPKPPTPTRSASMGGAPSSNQFGPGSACSSPTVSSSSGFNAHQQAPPIALIRAPPQQFLRGPQPMPWAAGHSYHHHHHQPAATAASAARTAAAPSQERSILASVQLSQQQQRSASAGGAFSTATGLLAAASHAAPRKMEQHQHQPHAPQPSSALEPHLSVAPINAVSSIQAALNQAMHAALQRKPEAYGTLDNFELFFDSVMHPGAPGKLDGPLPQELPDEVRYGSDWYKHARGWNAQNKPQAAYVPVLGAAAAAGSEPLPLTPPADVASLAGEAEQQPPGTPTWAVADEQQMSATCRRALDIANHGLPRVLTPAASSRSVSTVALASLPASAAPSILALHQQHQQQQAARAALLEDTAESKPRTAAAGAPSAVARNAAALTTALEALARGHAAAGTDGAHQSQQQQQLQEDLPTSAAASCSASPMPAAAPAAAPDALAPAPAATAVCATPQRAHALAIGAADLARAAAVMAVINGHETPVVPTAAKASLSEMLSPTPTRCCGGAGGHEPPSAATTPGPLTPGGAASTAPHTAANTPIAAATPGTAVREDPSSPSHQAPLPLVGADAPQHASSLVQQEQQHLLGAAATAGAIAAEPAAFDVTLPAPPVRSREPAPAASAATSLPVVSTAAATAAVWDPAFPPLSAAAAKQPVAGRRGVPSPVTLMQAAPRELPTPNPACLSSAVVAGPSGAPALAAAVAVMTGPNAAAARAMRSDPAGPSTSTAQPQADPLRDIVVGIEKLSLLKTNILAEDRAVDVNSITQMIQLKQAVDAMLARTRSAADAVVAAVAAAPPQPPQLAAAAADQQQQSETPKKLSRSASLGAFIKSVFSPRGSATKAAPAAAQQAAPAVKAATRAFGTNVTAAVNNAAAQAQPASPAVQQWQHAGASGVMAARPASASALPRQAASPSTLDKGRYAALNQRAAARLAAAASEPAGAQQASPAPAAQQRGDVWRRYEERVAVHRTQLDATKSQLDEAVRKLSGMQAEFDELLLCLGMESAKNKALCDALMAAGIDPEPILAAIEEQWMSDNGSE